MADAAQQPRQARICPASSERTVRAPGPMSYSMRTALKRESSMKAVMFAIVVVGLTAFFGVVEPTLASSTPVTSDSVTVASEQMVEPPADQMASGKKNGNKRTGTAA